VGVLVQLDVNTDVPFLRTVEGAAVSVQTGALDAMPVPLTFTLWGLPAALLATDTELDMLVAEAGLNVTLTVQDPLAATLEPQLCVTPNTLLALAMLLIVSAALPVLVSVTLRAALVVPTVWLVNVSAVGFRDTAGAAAALTVMLCVTGVAAL
jgi:hypothetical protein